MEALDQMNISELALLAQDHDPEAHRGLGRDTLVEIILDGPRDLPARQVNKVRLRIMQYVIDHWVQVRPLVQGCPARS